MQAYENSIMHIRFTDTVTGETWTSLLDWSDVEEYVAELPVSAWERLDIEVLPW